MRHLIRFITLRHLTVSPGRTLLTLFGVVLGVALVFAIDVVNGSVMASFRGSIDQMAGKTALVVGEGTGVDEELLDELRTVPGVAVAAPVIQESVRDVRRNTHLAVLAVDTMADEGVRDYEVQADDVSVEDDLAFLNDPKGVLVAASYAKKHGLKPGDVLRLETTRGESDFHVRGLLAPRGPAKVFGGDLLVMDVFAAQLAFERGRRFDHIDIVPLADEEPETLAGRIRSAIRQRASVTRPEQRTQDADRMLASFKLGLSVASLVALLVGGFIVYNALAIAVAQRRREIGILRALGATRRQIVSLFVGEGVLIGAVGSALGLGLGLGLAHASLATAGATVSELFLTVKPENLDVRPGQLVLALAVGIGASFVAALLPARMASRIEPAAAMRKRVESSESDRASMARSVRISAVIGILGGGVAAIAHMRESFLLGASVSVFLALATAFVAPALARLVGRCGQSLAVRRSPAVRLGVLGFERNAGRNAIAIAALGMALANVVNIACFLESMKQNTVHWFERCLRADIMVFAGQKVQARFDRPLPMSMLKELSALPGVELVNPLRMVRQQYENRPFYLLSWDLLRYREHDEIPVVAGDLDDALREIAAGTGIAASETFAREFQVELGDSLTLQTPAGPRAFRVALIYVDYSAEVGILTTTREMFTQIWKDSLIDSFGIYVKAPSMALPLRERIVRDFGGEHQLMVLGNAEYKAEVLAVFDRSFALMRSMEVVAILVSLLGIMNTLVVSVLDRTHELGILKAIGAVREQVKRMLITEALLIGLAAAVLGVLGGLASSMYTVKELVRFQLGWRIAWESAPSALIETVIVALVVAVIGAWFPTRRAAALSVVDALHHE